MIRDDRTLRGQSPLLSVSRPFRSTPSYDDSGVNSVSIADECITAVSKLRSGRGLTKPKFVIYKVSDDQKAVVVEESSTELDYEVFRQKLVSSVDAKGNPAPRYAVYDLEYDLGDEGKRCVPLQGCVLKQRRSKTTKTK